MVLSCLLISIHQSKLVQCQECPAHQFEVDGALWDKFSPPSYHQHYDDIHICMIVNHYCDEIKNNQIVNKKLFIYKNSFYTQYGCLDIIIQVANRAQYSVKDKIINLELLQQWLGGSDFNEYTMALRVNVAKIQLRFCKILFTSHQNLTCWCLPQLSCLLCI